MKIGYARVSRTDQNPELQTEALKKARAAKIFEDRISGAKETRAGLDGMLGQLREGDAVIVWRLDRLARSVKHLVELAGHFESKGVQLISLHENIDTTSPAGKLFFHITAAFAEFERNLIIERTSAGLDVARANGRRGGRRSAIDESKRKMIDDALKASKKNKRPPNISDIAHALSISERTVRRYCKGEHFVQRPAR